MFFQDAPPPEPCISLAIHGRLLEQDYDFYPEPEVGPDEILIRWKWRVTLRVDAVVLGALDGDRLQADSVQHQEYREDYGRTFLFIRHGGEYRLRGISPRTLSSRGDLARAAADWGGQLCDHAEARTS